MVHMTDFPAPPDLNPGAVRSLVQYAEQVVEYLEREIADAGARGLDPSPLPRLVEGWTFLATAIAESYDGRS